MTWAHFSHVRIIQGVFYKDASVVTIVISTIIHINVIIFIRVKLSERCSFSLVHRLLYRSECDNTWSADRTHTPAGRAAEGSEIFDIQRKAFRLIVRQVNERKMPEVFYSNTHIHTHTHTLISDWYKRVLADGLSSNLIQECFVVTLLKQNSSAQQKLFELLI